MHANSSSPIKPVWINGPRLRQRWGISNSTFYAHLRKGLIPSPEYPFGTAMPYWRMETVEQFEDSKKAAA